MYCKQCGHELGAAQRFCRSCGARNDAAVVSAPSHPPAAARPERQATPPPAPITEPMYTPSPTPPTERLYTSPRAAEPPQPPVPPAGRPRRGPSGRAGLIAALLVLSLAIAGLAVALILSKGSGKTSTTTDVLSSRSTTKPPTAAPTTPATPATTTATQPSSTSASTTTTTTTSTTAASSTSGASASGAGGAAAALRNYWHDIAAGNYSQAVAMETASERETDPETNMQAEAPIINIVSIGQPSADSGTADVAINFWAQDTKPTSFSDTQCRHFTMTAIMIQNGDGSWSYNGSVPGSASSTIEDGNPNCRS
jgi:hypothetical protein